MCQLCVHVFVREWITEYEVIDDFCPDGFKNTSLLCRLVILETRKSFLRFLYAYCWRASECDC